MVLASFTSQWPLELNPYRNRKWKYVWCRSVGSTLQELHEGGHVYCSWSQSTWVTSQDHYENLNGTTSCDVEGSLIWHLGLVTPHTTKQNYVCQLCYLLLLRAVVFWTSGQNMKSYMKTWNSCQKVCMKWIYFLYENFSWYKGSRI